MVPDTVTTGCFVSIAAVSGSGNTMVESNYATIPVAAGRGNCSDADSPLSASQAELWSSKPSVHLGTLSLDLESDGNIGGWLYSPDANFAVIPGSTLVAYVSQAPPTAWANPPVGLTSSGSCLAVPPWVNEALPPVPPYLGSLDAGDMTISGLGGVEPLREYEPYAFTGCALCYAGKPLLFSDFPASSTTLTFTADGGHDIGPFTATLNTLVAPSFNNLNSIATVDRSQGLTLTWTPASAGLVRIWGNSIPTVGGFWLAGSFSCAAPASDGQFTVPSYVLEALPAGTGPLSVKFYPNPQPFTALGLDAGVATMDALPVTPVNVIFQ